MDLARLNSTVCGISYTMTPEQVADIIALVSAAKSRIREIDDALADALIQYIRDTGRDLVIGTVRYYIGSRRVVRCPDVPQAVESLMLAAGGDMAAFCGVLSSNAIKPGAARRMLEEVHQEELFDRLFTTEFQDELRDGRPSRLQKIDTKFLPKGA